MKTKCFLSLFISLTVVVNLSLFGAVNLTNSPTESHWPAIAVNSRGEIMVIFTETVPEGSNDVYYMISTDGGNTWTQPQRTYTKTQHIKSCALAADQYGNFHLAYADGWGSGSREVYYRAYISGVWQDKERLSFSNNNSNWCRISADRDDVHIVWFQEVGLPIKPYIALKSKKIGGTWPTSPTDASRDTSHGAIYPDVKAKDGNIYVIFQKQIYEGNTCVSKHIAYSERINGIWNGPLDLGSYTWPAIDADDYQNVHCLYPHGGWVKYKAKINGSWQNEENIANKRGIACFFDIKYKNNCLIAAFMQEASRDSKLTSIYYSTKEYHGTWGAWTTPLELEPGSDGHLPKIAIDETGKAHIIWIDIGVGGEKDIYYENVGLYRSDMPYIQLDKYSLSFTTNEGGSPDSQTFQVKNSGAKTLNYSISTDKDWLSVNPGSGSSSGEWDTINVSVSSSSLSGGYHYGKITISSSDAPNSPQEIPVTLTVRPETPYLELDTESLSFTGYIGASNPPSQVFRIRNFGMGTMNYTNSADKFWLSVSPLSGSSTGEWDDISVSVDISELAEGNYSGMITVTSPEANNSPQSLTVNLTVIRGAAAKIKLNKNSLSFTLKKGEKNPNPKYFSVRNIGSGTLNYQISANEDWINVFPKTGSSKGENDKITVTVSAASLESGKHKGSVTVSSSNASNSPQTLKVSVTIESPGIKLNRTYLSFTGIKGEGNPDPKTFSIKNSGSGTLHYELKSTKDWIKFLPKQGTSEDEWDEITVSVNISSLSKGDYKGVVKVTSSDKDVQSQEVKVSLTVMTPSIEIIIPENKKSFTFTTQEGQSNPPSQVFWIKNAGAGTLNCELSSNKDWLRVSPKKEKIVRGEGAEMITVSVKSSSLDMGNYEGKITIKAPYADNSPQYITVNLEVKKPPYPYKPLDAQLEKIENVSLFYQVYINTLTWKRNHRNDAHFNINKYRIFRKEKGKTDDYYVMIDEVENIPPLEYQDSFSSKEERDKYRYAVAAYDEAQNKESEKAVCKRKN